MTRFLYLLFVPLLLLGSAATALSFPNNRWPNMGVAYSPAPNKNGCKEYPYCFRGRLWFRPAFTRVPSGENNLPAPPNGVSVLSLLGWTIGGVVALEYDDSPVGPYCEYVTMGGVVFKQGTIGQWGSRLYVSTKEAENVCRQIWSVPAEEADIQLEHGHDRQPLRVVSSPDSRVSSTRLNQIVVSGWRNTRILQTDDAETPKGGLPVMWTPSIKALWAPLRVPLPGQRKGESFPLHMLRLSASALRFRGCGQASSETLGIPWGVGLVVDNILIEIAPQKSSL